jgi:hypothetical protein
MTAAATDDSDLVATWTLPYAARLGSSIRSQGLYLEVRSQLPEAARKSLTVKAGELTLRMLATARHAFLAVSAIVSGALDTVTRRPVIPREIEDILGISATERRRWLEDGRLPSAGIRTVKLRGRGTITFHVFDPSVVQDLLEGDVIDAWREEDAERAAENRRRAIWKSSLARGPQKGGAAPSRSDDDQDRFKLRGWAEFERDGLLR